MNNKFIHVETLEYSVGLNKYIESEITYLNFDFIKSITPLIFSKKYQTKKFQDYFIDLKPSYLYLIEFKTDLIVCRILDKPTFLNT